MDAVLQALRPIFDKLGSTADWTVTGLILLAAFVAFLALMRGSHRYDDGDEDED